MLKGFALAISILLFPFQALACPDWLGWAVLHAAWVTPEYQKCTWQIDPRSSGGKTINIRAYGESRITFLGDKEIWIQAQLEFSSTGELVDIHWGSYKAFWPPNSGHSLIMQALSENPHL